MSPDRDPFELLSAFVDPEPDPVVMQAVIAQSREAFVNSRHSPARHAGSLAGWLRQSAIWLMPAGAGIAALAVAFVVAPGLLTTGRPSPSPNVATDLPNAASPTLSREEDNSSSQAPSSTGMAMQPPPNTMPMPMEVLPQTMSSFQGEGILIGTRTDASTLR